MDGFASINNDGKITFYCVKRPNLLETILIVHTMHWGGTNKFNGIPIHIHSSKSMYAIDTDPLDQIAIVIYFCFQCHSTVSNKF